MSTVRRKRGAKIQMTVDEVLAAATRPPATSLADRAYEAIRERLVMLDIHPGDPINDGQVATSIGVGRTPVREALKRLEADHLVVSYPRRGTFATPIDATELSAISEVRRQLAPFAARSAAARASTQQREWMRELAAQLASRDLGDGNRNTLIQLDMAVQSLVYRASGNAHLEDILTRYHHLATRIWCVVIDRLPGLSDHIAEHADLLEAVAEGDGDQAESLTRDHIDRFEHQIRQVL